MKEPILSREDVDEIFAEHCVAYPAHGSGLIATLFEDQFRKAAAALEAAILEKLCGEPVGQAGTMPGTDGFTMAAFRADDVPVGTPLYTLKDRQS